MVSVVVRSAAPDPLLAETFTVNDGRLVESGTHESLLEAGGFYAELYNSQFENCG